MEKKVILIDEETIQTRIKELAQEINKDYKGKELTLICILKGSMYFFTDLTRHLDLDTNLEFMRISTYEGKESKGKIDVKLDLDKPIKGKDVLVVEDIIDTGITLSFLLDYLAVREPKSIKLCTLLDKPDRRTEENVKVDYTGFIIPDRFVIGYGLDLDEKYRNLKEINCIIDENDRKKIEEEKKLIKKQIRKP